MAQTPTERAIANREKRSRTAYAKRLRVPQRSAILPEPVEEEVVLAEATGADARHGGKSK